MIYVLDYCTYHILFLKRIPQKKSKKIAIFQKFSPRIRKNQIKNITFALAIAWSDARVAEEARLESV